LNFEKGKIFNIQERKNEKFKELCKGEVRILKERGK